MALVGGGGSPNVGGGSNPAGTGQALNFVGVEPRHAYAYSGVINVSAGSSADTPFLVFNTGSSIVVGDLAFTVTQGGNSDIFFNLKMDGQIVIDARYSQTQYATEEQAFRIVIPPFTKVEGILGADNTQDMTMIFAGRAYE